MAAEVVALIGFLTEHGAVGFLVAAMLGSYRKWWVWGHDYDELRRERDTWREIALSSTSLAARATDLVGGRP